MKSFFNPPPLSELENYLDDDDPCAPFIEWLLRREGIFAPVTKTDAFMALAIPHIIENKN